MKVSSAHGCTLLFMISSFSSSLLNSSLWLVESVQASSTGTPVSDSSNRDIQSNDLQ